MAIYNRIYSKEKWDLVCKYNKNLMDDFLLELKSQKKSQGTINQYKNDLRILFIYIHDELDNKEIYKLKKKHFRNYMLWLQEKDMSNARINRLMSALRSMLEFGSNEEDYEDELEINYAQKVKGLQKEKVREIIFLTDEEVEYIYTRLIEEEKYQQALLCALMYDSAGRRKECFQVTKDSIIDEGNFTNQVIGKRNKKFRLMYHGRTKSAMKLLMKNRGNDDIESLWTTTVDGKLVTASYETLYAWVISWRKILAEKFDYKEFNPHSFRHSCANNLENGTHYVSKELNKKFELFQIQKLMNHSDISTTQSYLQDKSEDELLEAFGLF